MRYRKGTICISAEADVPLLRHVRNCRFVSHSQLFELLQLDSVVSSRNSFNWRIERLLKMGYLDLVPKLYFAHSQVYSVSRRGLVELESFGEHAVSLNSGTKHLPHPSQVFHALELTNFRLTLGRKRMLAHWQSEVEISSSNMVSSAPFAKDYDALVDIWLGNEVRRVALEYERTLKSAKEYEHIKTAIESDRQVPCVLYLVPHPDVLLALLQQLTPAAKVLGFVMLRTLCDELLATRIVTADGREMVSFEEFLKYAHPLYIQAS